MLVLEKHYRVNELVALWGYSAKIIIGLFSREPGVLSIDNIGSGKKKYAVLSIPESVALRVQDRLAKKSQENLPQPKESRRVKSEIRPREIGKLGLAKKKISR